MRGAVFIALVLLAPGTAFAESSVVGRVIERQGGAIAAAIAAPVERVTVVAGDSVRSGDTLATLDTADRAADLTTARAQIAVAEAQLRVREAALNAERASLERIARLRGSAAFNAARFEDSQKEVLRLQAEIVVARAQIEEARARVTRLLVDIERARILAPYDAVVTSREVEVGDFVTPGRRMFTLLNLRALEVEADVPVSYSKVLQPGARLLAQTRDGVEIALEVRAVIPVENALTRTRAVRFRVYDGNALAVGQPLEIALPTRPEG